MLMILIICTKSTCYIGRSFCERPAQERIILIFCKINHAVFFANTGPRRVFLQKQYLVDRIFASDQSRQMIDNLQKACYTRPSFLQETTKQDDPDFCKEKEKLILDHSLCRNKLRENHFDHLQNISYWTLQRPI